MQPASNLAHALPLRRARELDVLVVDAGGFSIKYDYALCEALAQAECSVTLVSSEYRHARWDDPSSFEVRKHFYRRAHAAASESGGGFGWKLRKAVEHAGDMKRLAQEIERRRPDVVHFQWLPLPIVDSVYLRRMAAVAPLVLTIHNTTIFHGTPTSRAQGLGFRSALKSFSAFIAHAQYSKEKMVRQGWANEDQIAVIPHGAFQNGAAPASQAQGLEKQVLFLGSIRPYKAPDLLIRAFGKLPREVRENTRLTIAGKPGMDLTPLFRLAAELGVADRITWIPRYLAEEEAQAMYRSATVVALPFREIDQSGALLNAIGWGKPLVTTAIGGVSETIQDGVNGLLVPAGDVDAFSSALLRLLTSPDLRAMMHARLLSLANGELSWRNVAAKTQQLYSKLAGSGRNIHLAGVSLP